VKYRRYVVFALAMLGMLTAPPVCAHAQTALSSSDVQCVVEPIYAFTLPHDASLQYPQTQLMAGEFQIGELLLASGETLSVMAEAGALKSPEGEELPYAVLFEPPQGFDEKQSGEAYAVTVFLDEDAWGASPAGTYTASLRLSVMSYPAGKVVWQDEMTLMAVKTQGQGISGEDIPATGFFSGGYWRIPAAVAALSVTAVILRLRHRREKQRQVASGTDEPITNDIHSAPG
jgi:hypothetical protein